MKTDTGKTVALNRNLTVEGDAVNVDTGDGIARLFLRRLPEPYIRWIEQGRRSMYGQLAQSGETVRFFSQHLPMIVTHAGEGAFPFNCGNKGVGWMPKPDYMEEFTQLFQATMQRTRKLSIRESMRQRLEAVSKFYFDREKIDYRAMTSLEIFEKRTFRNLCRRPMASLLFTGECPAYTSFQLNCVVEVVGPDDPRHTFISLARNMFEDDYFHIAQSQFSYAYIFWITEVLDKTPFRVERRPAQAKAASQQSLRWHDEALCAIERAPGMVRKHIREHVEKYAREKGIAEIDARFLREAKKKMSCPVQRARGEPLERPARYRRIYVALDGSDGSRAAGHFAVSIAKRHKAQMTGSHVYAARLHDQRFRAMESGLPEAFQKETELERQRKIHDSLITKGLELITDSYLQNMARTCAEKKIPFHGVSLEGKNWKALARNIAERSDDLVAMGGHGVGRTPSSLLGTVAERVLRRVRKDVLVCKAGSEKSVSDRIVVCLDGSARSWGALMRGLQLARDFNKKLTAVSAFDPYFHYTMFSTLNRALSDKARKVFKFEQQEKLHEDIIDSGLAKIYQSHLDIARRIASDEKMKIETRLLDGKAFEKILEIVREDPPWLLILGRTGVHGEADMELGGTTANVCRQAKCNVLVVDTEGKPPVEYQVEETVAWTKEARTYMNRVPEMARPMAMKAVQQHCLAMGHTVVSTSVLREAVRQILPSAAMEKMGIRFGENESGTNELTDKIALTFRCEACGHVHHGMRPGTCPVCGAQGHTFTLSEHREVKDGVAAKTMDGRTLVWEKSALALLDSLDAVTKRSLKAKVEKRALRQRLEAITREMVEAAQPTTQDASKETRARVSGKQPWTDAATRRLKRVPEGFMREAAARMIEEYAEKSGAKTVTLEAAEEGLRKARQKMTEAMRGGMGGSGVDGRSAQPRNSERGSEAPLQDKEVSPSFECELCGYVVDGGRPVRCASCANERFQMLAPEDRARLPAEVCLLLEWTSAALARIEKVPAGFMRTMTRGRVELWARRHGHARVTTKVVAAKYNNWEKGSRELKRVLDWSAGAEARLMRIPPFVRPMVVREVEHAARDLGRDSVDEAFFDEVVKQWQGNQKSFHNAWPLDGRPGAART